MCVCECLCLFILSYYACCRLTGCGVLFRIKIVVIVNNYGLNIAVTFQALCWAGMLQTVSGIWHMT